MSSLSPVDIASRVMDALIKRFETNGLHNVEVYISASGDFLVNLNLKKYSESVILETVNIGNEVVGSIDGTLRVSYVIHKDGLKFHNNLFLLGPNNAGLVSSESSGLELEIAHDEPLDPKT